MLQLRSVDTYYGRIKALHELSLDVGRGSVVAIIGPNGSGKSTVVKTITGLCPAHAGAITFCGRRIDKLRPDEVVRAGIALVPQGRQLFGSFSVQENLEMGAYTRNDRSAVREDMRRIFAIFPILEERRRQQAATLSGGEQQMLAIARALLTGPKLLLLDEPSIGLAPAMVDRVFDRIADINRAGVTVLIVEQNVMAALSISSRAYVLESGQVSMTADSSSLLRDDRIRGLFLGAGTAAAEQS